MGLSLDFVIFRIVMQQEKIVVTKSFFAIILRVRMNQFSEFLLIRGNPRLREVKQLLHQADILINMIRRHSHLHIHV